MILFNSDYLEGCHPAILKHLQETNLEQTPGYGVDDYCAKARETVRSLCDAPDADVHFLVGGTQTNATFISSVLKPYQGVLCADTGHINVHETGAIEHSGHKVLGLPSIDGKVAAATVKSALEEHFSEDGPEHCVQPGLLYISQPTELGTLYSLRELLDLKEVCNEWNIPLYVDGARLGYALASDACDITLQDLAAVADAFYIGGTKQGALFGEVLVIRNDALKTDFRYNIKQNGGLLAKGRLLGIQFETLLGSASAAETPAETVKRIEDSLYFALSRNADILAERIRAAFAEAGYPFLVSSPTNQQFPILTTEMADALAADFGFETWRKIDENHVAVRFCTSWSTGTTQVDALVGAIAKLSAK